jgi:hypothetical protein
MTTTPQDAISQSNFKSINYVLAPSHDEQKRKQQS